MQASNKQQRAEKSCARRACATGAVERVRPGRRKRRVLRKSASERPAVVGCGTLAHRLPPGRVSLSHDARCAGKEAS
eukprot:418491-Pleurochrysis_carterae.AAC.2